MRYAARVRRLPSLVLFALATTASVPAFAQSWGARLVRTLDSIGAADLVTDKHGKVHVSALLPPGISPGAVGLVGFDDDTASKHLSPADVIRLGEAHPEIEIHVGPGLRPLLDSSKKWTRAELFRKETGFDGKGVVVGIIDTGIDILHPDFRNADGSTRIKWLLQEGAPAGKHPELEQQYCGQLDSSCAVLDEADINALLANEDPGGTGDTSGHGTHVTSIAAGNGGPSQVKNPRYVGVAPGADLVIGAMQSFGDDDVAWAAQFIFDRAKEMGEPCALNVSLGSDYGAHDGTDILDRRLARLVGDRQPGRAIVVAAGNSAPLFVIDGEDKPWGFHTETRVYPHADVRVPIRVPAAQEALKGYLWITFDPGDEVSVGFEKADGSTWVGAVDPGHENSVKDGDRKAGIVNNKYKPDAALVPPSNGAVIVWEGKWDKEGELAVHLSGKGHAHLWVTTDAPSEELVFLFKGAIKQGTINVPATSPSLLAVGCSINRNAWRTWKGPVIGVGDDPLAEPDSVCYFSSAGPTPAGVAKPELIAPGGYVVGAMAKTADPRMTGEGLFWVPAESCPKETPSCFVSDDYHAVATGTSMSAPHVTGAVALLFQANPTLTQAQVTEVLQAGARYPRGAVRYESQLGPGELDLIGALRALGEEQADFADPDASKSWYVMSSEYARPDSSWPVQGTVELRRADGTVAHALSGDLLKLTVTNGVVLAPLLKVRHGLYRFTVAGQVGKGGQPMTIDVTYDGKSLGKKVLPVQDDPWAQDFAADAIGSCATSGSPSRTSGAWGAIALSLVFAIRRRRARRGAQRSLAGQCLRAARG